MTVTVTPESYGHAVATATVTVAPVEVVVVMLPASIRSTYTPLKAEEAAEEEEGSWPSNRVWVRVLMERWEWWECEWA